MKEKRPLYAFGKRCLDIFGALAGLTLLWPIGAVIALLIKASDGGPAIFQQTRVGRYGKPFQILKFRSMLVSADKIGLSVTNGADPRVTRVGRILRRTKLDELPQLWNVLVGDMSLVGPRPEVPRYVEQYSPHQREILRYRPGITDLASLLFRDEEAILKGARDVERFYVSHCLPKKIELNRHYAEHATALRDIWIILQTLCPYWLGSALLYGLSLSVCLWLSYELRHDFQLSRGVRAECARALPWLVLSQLLALAFWGQLRSAVSYFSIFEARKLLQMHY